MRHVISVLVENKFGVLARISGLFSARGFNINSLAVGETEDPGVSRMTIVVEGDDRVLEQVKKQLNKLIETIKVQDYTGKEFIDKELVIVKLKSTDKTKQDIINMADSVGARVINARGSNIILEITGDQSKVKTFFELIKGFGIKEVVRTGRIAMGTDTELLINDVTD